MPDVALDIRKHLAGIVLILASVQVLGRNAKLDDEIAGKVFGLDFAAFFPPEPEKGGFVIAHNDPGVRSPDEITAF
jgi:hypothetical protein